MLVRVKALGRLARITGGSEVELETQRSTVGSFLQEILTQAGETHGDINSMLVSLNGVEISALKGAETPLTQGDIVVLIPVVHGG